MGTLHLACRDYHKYDLLLLVDPVVLGSILSLPLVRLWEGVAVNIPSSKGYFFGLEKNPRQLLRSMPQDFVLVAIQKKFYEVPM